MLPPLFDLEEDPLVFDRVDAPARDDDFALVALFFADALDDDLVLRPFPPPEAGRFEAVFPRVAVPFLALPDRVRLRALLVVSRATDAIPEMALVTNPTAISAP